MEKKLRKRPLKHNIIFGGVSVIYFIISKVTYYYSGDLVATLCLMIFLLAFIGFTIFSRKVNKTRLAGFYKEITTLIWNIVTSFTFTYGVYLLIRYETMAGIKENISVDYIHTHPIFSYIVLGLLVVISIIRASITIAETIDNIAITFTGDAS
ncbi:hypothetical protein [Pectobacterium brasiliense]|uniref:hypothetical protein n=1 Tax=Pectobacterium brasiliense TaxID=180957 RepID=UPI001968ED4B|nr:hypothetical protein [Pectobacterium brasiliense]MBN3123842.1 hypothetical protein [Pectobacterium brasiliense]QSD24183.1 hypothetical protein H5A38_07725 [Pectobacterium brasiliense]